MFDPENIMLEYSEISIQCSIQRGMFVESDRYLTVHTWMNVSITLDMKPRLNLLPDVTYPTTHLPAIARSPGSDWIQHVCRVESKAMKAGHTKTCLFALISFLGSESARPRSLEL